jgi:hypothetical protein
MPVVTSFCGPIKHIAEHYHISVILSVGAGKHKAGQGYTNDRDALFGSTAWGRHLDQTATLKFVGDITNPRRKLVMSLRQSAGEEFDLEFNRLGHLVEAQPKPEDVDELLEWTKAQIRFEASEAIKAAVKNGWGLGRTAVYNRLKAYKAKGLLASLFEGGTQFFSPVSTQ